MSAAELFFRVVMDTSWRMSCLIVICLVLRSVLRDHLPARVLYWVWIAVAVRLLLPLAAPVKWSPFNLAHLTRLDPSEMANIKSVSGSGPAETMKSLPAGSDPARPAMARPTGPVVWTTVQWAALGWTVGVAVLVIGRFCAYRRFVACIKPTDGNEEDTVALLAAEAAGHHGGRGVQVAVSHAVGAPTLQGIFRPKILFPAGFLDRLNPAEIRLILAHEIGHCERHDLMAQALIQTAQILHWFNPLVWVAARAARQDCELACDEHVLRRLGAAEPQIYGATLLKILGMVSRTPRGPFVLGIMESKQHMKWRIKMIIADHKPSLTRTLLSCALIGLAGVFSLTREMQAEPAGTVKKAAPSRPESVFQAKLPSFGDSDYSRAVEAIFSSYEKMAGHRLAPGAKKRVGLKVYTDSGPGLATPLPLVHAVIAALERRGFEKANIFLVGLNQVHLQDAGFLPAMETDGGPFAGYRVFVIESGETDQAGWFYDSPLPQRWALNHEPETKAIEGKSYLDAPLILDTDFWIDLPIYTDHPTAGVNGALLNATLWNASNTARFIDSAVIAPMAVAEMSAIPELRGTWVFTLASLQSYQYYGGPAYDPRYIVSEPYLWLSADPVMMDSLMRDRLNGWRRRNGLPAISEKIHTLEYAATLDVGSADISRGKLIPVKF